MIISLSEPSGIQHQQVELEWLKEKIFEPNVAYWDIAGEQATHILFQSEDKFCEIVVGGIKNVGLQVLYGDIEELVLTADINDKSVVEVFGKSSLVKYYRKNFLPKNVAWQAIEYFAKTGDKDPNLNWQPREIPRQDFVEIPTLGENQQFIFTDPMTDEHKFFDVRWLKRLVLEKGDDYWTVMNGESMISLLEFEKTIARLHFFHNEEYGFVINYSGTNETSLSAINKDSRNEIIEVTCYGQSDLYFEKYLITRENTWKVIDHFLNTGRKQPQLEWEILEMPEQEF